MLANLDIQALLAVIVALGLGGFVKGATGSGAPLVAVPVMAAFYDVKMAIVVMVVPNLVNNALQAWSYREHIHPPKLALFMALGSIPGIFLGTRLLSALEPETLSLALGVLLVCYLLLRIFNPQAELGRRVALFLSFPAGFGAGLLHGTAGISGPAAVLFLSTMNLARPAFVGTISAFFVTGAVAHIPALWQQDLLTWNGLMISTLALIPVSLCLQLGNRAARRLPKETFNRWVLVLIAVLAARLLWRGLA
ncbi:sulfite exporter TauE/SafE family protein [Histidinibacterium aquaticum]|uniref:Probable membrane transporter protein n=1 Tax=Histidinibacterium aquaticum TaxID=2613962 RepID=A0A5J5GFE3_9RHOB|nr:sulfite exporter TauE/SafE family protein [Histidinibacterium aquaticum]KAA9006777.1 sulfite exporter TauE/SafE family protein [Histidinibacterium aquaticum]